MVESIKEIIERISPYYRDKKGPENSHTLVYDSSSETLEPIYFFIVDLMNDFGLNPEKYADNFISSPGSGHFSEMGGKASVMQQQGSKLLVDINMILKSVLNIIYDLKDFKIRLEHYNDLYDKDQSRAQASRLALKQLWLDKVDLVQKGQGSIHAMSSGNLQFTTLRDAFMAADSAKDVSKMDLNNRVKGILSPRIEEFNIWLKHSEQELRKRYELERNYLKTQVNSLTLYSRWAKPYLKAAQQLEMKDGGRSPSLVKMFNTILLELTLLGKSKLKIKDLAIAGDLPAEFSRESFTKNLKRDYYSCILVDFNFRGIPNKIQGTQHYAFGGRAEITFSGYALNKEELAQLNKEMEKSELGDVLKLVEGITDESLEQMRDEINFFLEEKEIEEKGTSKDSSNPFAALMGRYDKSSKKEETKPKKEELDKPIKPDNWIEKEHIRKLAAATCQDISFKLFDIYKKAHGMVSFT